MYRFYINAENVDELVIIGYIILFFILFFSTEIVNCSAEIYYNKTHLILFDITKK